MNLKREGRKYEFGRLTDLARAGPVAVTKHGRAVVVVIAVEEYGRLNDIEMDKENGRSDKNSGLRDN